jgi:hypothetical protein
MMTRRAPTERRMTMNALEKIFPNPTVEIHRR